MSFNIRGARRLDGRNVWRKRAELNARVIREHRPDLIGFQELQRRNLRTYEKKLPGYECVLGPRYENRRPHAFNAICWRPGRLELVESGGFWLSETPDDFSRSWGARQVRSANWARFRCLPEGPEFLHLNTHLDHVSGKARVEASETIVKWLSPVDVPVVITGDFNAEPGRPTYSRFVRAGFVDVHAAVGGPPANTFHRFLGDEFVSRKRDREWRIDWILIRDGTRGGRWTPGMCEVIRDSEPPVYPSDHYPVLARLSLG